MTEETQAPAGAEEVAAAANDVGLSLQDISACVQIIDVVSQRGAIKGNELQAVGTLREKLVTFLKAAGAQTPDVEGTEEQVAEEEAAA